VTNKYVRGFSVNVKDTHYKTWRSLT
jgi:hypothetical protein